jgi:hypothetical protein
MVYQFSYSAKQNLLNELQAIPFAAGSQPFVDDASLIIKEWFKEQLPSLNKHFKFSSVITFSIKNFLNLQDVNGLMGSGHINQDHSINWIKTESELFLQQELSKYIHSTVLATIDFETGVITVFTIPPFLRTKKQILITK